MLFNINFVSLDSKMKVGSDLSGRFLIVTAFFRTSDGMAFELERSGLVQLGYRIQAVNGMSLVDGDDDSLRSSFSLRLKKLQQITWPATLTFAPIVATEINVVPPSEPQSRIRSTSAGGCSYGTFENTSESPPTLVVTQNTYVSSNSEVESGRNSNAVEVVIDKPPMGITVSCIS